MEKFQDVKRFRKLLGNSADKLTDEEVKKIMDTQYQIADIIFDRWLNKINQKKNDNK